MYLALFIYCSVFRLDSGHNRPVQAGPHPDKPIVAPRKHDHRFAGQLQNRPMRRGWQPALHAVLMGASSML